MRRDSPGIVCGYTCLGVYNRHERIERNGYWAVLLPDHPCASSQGYVMEHRLVAMQVLGRTLVKDEVVHHINGNKKDNRPRNLRVLTFGEHSAIHARESRPVGSWRFEAKRPG